MNILNSRWICKIVFSLLLFIYKENIIRYVCILKRLKNDVKILVCILKDI